MVTLDFPYDIGSPNVYMAWKGLSATPGVELRWTPVLLGGLFKAAGNRPPWQAFGGVPAKMRYMMAEIARFQKLYGLDAFKMNPHFPVNTLLAMRAATAARVEGGDGAVPAALLTAMWEEGVDLSDAGELARVLSGAGLDGERLVARASEPEIKAALAEATGRYSERGVFGLPTWWDEAGEMYFGKDCVWMMHPERKAVLAG